MNVSELLDEPVTSEETSKKFGFKYGDSPLPKVNNDSPFVWGDIITYKAEKDPFKSKTTPKFLVVKADVEAILYAYYANLGKYPDNVTAIGFETGYTYTFSASNFKKIGSILEGWSME